MKAGLTGGDHPGVRTDVSTDGLLAASIANFVETWWLMGGIDGADRRATRGVKAFATGLEFPLLNGIVETRLPDGDADRRIEEELEAFAARRLPFVWWVLPGDEPADLAERLEAAGLSLLGRWPAMAIDLETLPAPPAVEHLEIRPVRDRHGFKQHLDVVQRAMELPAPFLEAMRRLAAQAGFGPDAPIQSYVGALGGRPVSASALILAGGAAGTYNVGTLDEFRGRGIGAALTVEPLHDARVRGYRIGTLQSSPMGYSVYERLGFRECAGFRPYRRV